MNMKKMNYLLTIAVFIFVLASCKKDNNSSSTPITNYVKSKNLTGVIQGTLKSDSTYYLTGNITIPKGDTLTILPGATVKATGNFSINLSGYLVCVGTPVKTILLTTNSSPVIGQGYWGGIQADSFANITMKYTHMNWTGGSDGQGGYLATIDVEGTQLKDYKANIVIENNWFFSGEDDGIHLAGIVHASIKRNILQHMGGPDGETMNIKRGVQGDIAYNYIWSAANNGIKLETGSAFPQTTMNIFNNTIINGGWRKVGEFTNGILIDKSAAANIFNNIIVGNHAGINITNISGGSDTAHCLESNNLIYFRNDSSLIYAFPGKNGSNSDITGAGISLCNSVFAKYDTTFNASLSTFTPDVDIPTLAGNSPAIGKGLKTLETSSLITGYYSPNIKGATQDVLDDDMGAFTTDNKNNCNPPLPSPSQGSK